jgi:hypothetical protein
MKQCVCRFCLKVLASEQLDFPIVHGTPDDDHGARVYADSTVQHRDGGLFRKFLLHPLRYVGDRSLKPFAMRLQD